VDTTSGGRGWCGSSRPTPEREQSAEEGEQREQDLPSECGALLVPGEQCHKHRDGSKKCERSEQATDDPQHSAGVLKQNSIEQDQHLLSLRKSAGKARHHSDNGNPATDKQDGRCARLGPRSWCAEEVTSWPGGLPSRVRPNRQQAPAAWSCVEGADTRSRHASVSQRAAAIVAVRILVEMYLGSQYTA
jgi:hypothetical protein